MILESVHQDFFRPCNIFNPPPRYYKKKNDMIENKDQLLSRVDALEAMQLPLSPDLRERAEQELFDIRADLVESTLTASKKESEEIGQLLERLDATKERLSLQDPTDALR